MPFHVTQTKDGRATIRIGASVRQRLRERRALERFAETPEGELTAAQLTAIEVIVRRRMGGLQP